MPKFLLEILNYPNNGTTPGAYIYPYNKKSQIAEKKKPRISNKPQGEVKSQIPLDATPLILSLSLSLQPTIPLQGPIKHETSFANRAA